MDSIVRALLGWAALLLPVLATGWQLWKGKVAKISSAYCWYMLIAPIAGTTYVIAANLRWQESSTIVLYTLQFWSICSAVAIFLAPKRNCFVPIFSVYATFANSLLFGLLADAEEPEAVVYVTKYFPKKRTSLLIYYSLVSAGIAYYLPHSTIESLEPNAVSGVIASIRTDAENSNIKISQIEILDSTNTIVVLNAQKYLSVYNLEWLKIGTPVSLTFQRTTSGNDLTSLEIDQKGASLASAMDCIVEFFDIVATRSDARDFSSVLAPNISINQVLMKNLDRKTALRLFGATSANELILHSLKQERATSNAAPVRSLDPCIIDLETGRRIMNPTGFKIQMSLPNMVRVFVDSKCFFKESFGLITFVLLKIDGYWRIRKIEFQKH